MGNKKMIIELVAGQLFLAIYNLANVAIDAYKIINHKTVAHAVNFILYLSFIFALLFIMRIPISICWLFGMIAFFNRQFTFDIPLNLRRDLPWYYQTKAVGKNASVLDRLERRIFGNADNVGKKIFNAYLV